MTDLIVAQTGAGPTLLILDDIQWIDELETSGEILWGVVGRSAQAPGASPQAT